MLPRLQPERARHAVKLPEFLCQPAVFLKGDYPFGSVSNS
jgi:hypothetical protein